MIYDKDDRRATALKEHYIEKASVRNDKIMEGHEALFFDTHQVVAMIRDYLERNGYKREPWEQWSVMLTVQGAVITGIRKPDPRDKAFEGLGLEET